ncbi:MAG: S8 family serine peptidase [Bacteroidales bacterium]
MKQSFPGFFTLFILIHLAITLNAAPISGDTAKTVFPESWAYQFLNIARQKARAGVVIKVAVVDDGFRLSHKTLRDFIYTNDKEVAGNFQDDDQNGCMDDIHGWDISDNDHDVSVPKGQEVAFYHGTYIAGIIVTVFQKCFGDDASKILKIIPVKVLSDHAPNRYFADGYKGIKYASDIGADIICCAWSGGQFSEEEKAILDAAIKKGVIVIGAAGNFYRETADPPSSFPGVFCVAALDTSLRKSKYSNFGMRVDLAAPGDSVYGPHPLADNAFVHENGTSPATAIVAGCAAILKALDPGASPVAILDALTNTATPVDSLNLTWCGKLGAGLPNMAKAETYFTSPEYRFSSFASSRSKGKISYRKKQSQTTWNIRPDGAYKGIHFKSECAANKKMVKIFTGDSLGYTGNLEGLSKWVFIPGSRFSVELMPETGLPKEFELSYYMETIDSTTLYCHGIQDISQNDGTLEDGSGEVNYANNCSCKWQVAVRSGERIRVQLTAIDTQPNTDFIWIFDGTSTLPEHLLAKFSGTEIPPVITSYTNKILIWFVTDSHTTGQGWKLKYSGVKAD